MPYFVVYALDKQDMAHVRGEHRPAHRARLRDTGRADLIVHVGGPLTDDAGQMNGSMLIIEAPTKASVQTFIDGDPYMIAGLYAQVDIRAFQWGLGTPKETLNG